MTADAVGGVWTYATELAAGLRAAGVEVVLAVLGPPPSEVGPNVRVIDAPLDWAAETPGAVLEAGRRVAALADAERVDLVHLNSPALAAGGAFRGPLLGVCHSDVATWWSAVKRGPLPDDLAWRAELTGRGYAACDALLAPTEAFAEATAAAFGLAQAPEVVRNGRTLNPARPGAGRDPGSVRFGGGAESVDRPGPGTGAPALAGVSGGEKPSAFACGRLWDEGKGMATLNAAAAHVSVPITAAGPLQGPGTGLADFPHLITPGSLGPMEVARLQAECAMFVAPSLYEPFGLAVLEAAQLGRPLVLSDIPTFRELWDGAAAFFPPGDAEALAAMLNGLSADERERDRLGRAALARSARYTAEAMVQGTLAVYRRLALAPAEAAA